MIIKLLREQRSTAALSFALNSFTYMLFILILISLGDLGLIFGGMTYATQAAARAAAVQTGVTLGSGGTSCTSATQVAQLITNLLPGLLPATSTTALQGDIKVQTSWVNNSGGSSTGSGAYLQVTSTYLWAPPVGPLRVTIPLGISATQMVQGTSGTIQTSCS
jgi:hypothetical protein